jgi:hypothetical protein
MKRLPVVMIVPLGAGACGGETPSDRQTADAGPSCSALNEQLDELAGGEPGASTVAPLDDLAVAADKAGFSGLPQLMRSASAALSAGLSTTATAAGNSAALVVDSTSTTPPVQHDDHWHGKVASRR